MASLSLSSVFSDQAPPEPVATVAEAPGSGTGPGHRLAAAFAALDSFPALAQSCNQLLRATCPEHPSTGEAVAAIEGDPALTVAVLRLANNFEHARPGGVESVIDAVGALPRETLAGLAQRTVRFDFFGRMGAGEGAPERFRMHAIATQRAAMRLADETGYSATDRLMATALLHDVGKLVLAHMHPSYPDGVHAGARTPEKRARNERRELGMDHALVGGVLARRWRLPQSIAEVIEGHHSPDAHGESAYVRLADMLAHYAHGGAVSPAELLNPARAIGLRASQLRSVMGDLPYPQAGRRKRRQTTPCPLSEREREALRGLAAGRGYKQIAVELSVSASTVRTHLHNAYRKIGAENRGQAVLLAGERGWL